MVFAGIQNLASITRTFVNLYTVAVRIANLLVLHSLLVMVYSFMTIPTGVFSV